MTTCSAAVHICSAAVLGGVRRPHMLTRRPHMLTQSLNRSAAVLGGVLCPYLLDRRPHMLDRRPLMLNRHPRRLCQPQSSAQDGARRNVLHVLRAHHISLEVLEYLDIMYNKVN
ncbi:MAG TPA: hypothetical protein VIK64_16935 [Anaerolineales bacterium]